jgi:hypothetical protein
MNEAESEHKNRASEATSFGSPILPIGRVLRQFLEHFLLAAGIIAF